MDIPMLTEEEWAVVSPHLSNAIEQISTYRKVHGCSLEEATRRGLADALDAYARLTGFNETNPNALWHHRLSLYGPPCHACGKPLRTPQAQYCAMCSAHALPADTVGLTAVATMHDDPVAKKELIRALISDGCARELLDLLRGLSPFCEPPSPGAIELAPIEEIRLVAAARNHLAFIAEFGSERAHVITDDGAHHFASPQKFQKWLEIGAPGLTLAEVSALSLS